MRGKHASGTKHARNYLQNLQTCQIWLTFDKIDENGPLWPFKPAIEIESLLAKQFHRSIKVVNFT